MKERGEARSRDVVPSDFLAHGPPTIATGIHTHPENESLEGKSARRSRVEEEGTGAAKERVRRGTVGSREEQARGMSMEWD